MDHEFTLKDLLVDALKKYNFDSSIVKMQVEQAYKEVVGEFIVKLTRSIVFDDNSRTLIVCLASPALRQELSYKTTDLLKAINSKLQGTVVNKIVLK